MTRPRHDRLEFAPLLEAVFELRAETGTPFSLLPGTMAQSLASRFPDVSETDMAKLVGVMELPKEAGLVVTHRFSSRSGKRTVQLGPNGIALAIQDYLDSSDFEEWLKPTVASYLERAQVRRIGRLGLRYINSVRETDALKVNVQWPEMPGSEQIHTLTRARFRFSNPEGFLAVVIAAPEPIGLRLDLDFWLNSNRAMTEVEVFSWFDRAHERIYESFVSVVRPEAFRRWKEGARPRE